MDTLDFFRELYGQCKEGWLTIWTRPDRKTYWFPVEQLEQAASMAKKLAELRKDVYFGVGLRREQVYKEKNGVRYLARGENEDVLALPGLWIDVDVADDAHKERALPPSLADAVSLVQSFQREPSILVHSGHGLHAYWLFREPLIIRTPEDQARAENLTSRFQATIRDAALKKGWKLDNTSDLARVLRVPGTMNYKTEPRPVKVIKVTEHAAAV